MQQNMEGTKIYKIKDLYCLLLRGNVGKYYRLLTQLRRWKTEFRKFLVRDCKSRFWIQLMSEEIGAHAVLVSSRINEKDEITCGGITDVDI